MSTSVLHIYVHMHPCTHGHTRTYTTSNTPAKMTNRRTTWWAPSDIHFLATQVVMNFQGIILQSLKSQRLRDQPFIFSTGKILTLFSVIQKEIKVETSASGWGHSSAMRDELSRELPDMTLSQLNGHRLVGRKTCTHRPHWGGGGLLANEHP